MNILLIKEKLHYLNIFWKYSGKNFIRERYTHSFIDIVRKLKCHNRLKDAEFNEFDENLLKMI